MNCIIVMVVLCILLLSLFNNDIIILNILCKCYASCAYHIYILILIDEADRTEVGYVCLWEGTYYGSKFLQLFNSWYHMVGRSSEVPLSGFSDIKMENVKYNNRCYDVSMQGIEITKTRTYQEVCIYPEREFFLYDWYWSMAYTCIINPTNEGYIFPKFSKTVFKSGESIIDYRVSLLFRKIYEHFYKLVQHYKKG